MAKKLGSFSKWRGLSSVKESLNILKNDKEVFQAIFRIEKIHLNPVGLFHGGYHAILVDFASHALLANSGIPEERRKSTDLSMEYLNSAALGDELLVDARALKIGKKISFLEVNILNKDNNKLLSKASHIFATD